MTLSQTGTAFTVTSALMTLIATICHMVGFGADFWLTSDGMSGRPFVRIGMHEACFNKCTQPYCPAGDDFTFDGCWRLYDEQFTEIRWWLTPAWFENVRLLTILAVPLISVTMFVLLAAALVLACWRYPHAKPRSRDILLQVLLFVGAALQLTSGLLLIIILAYFYMNAFRQEWMPLWDKNRLGFCYWLEAIAVLMMTFGFCLSLSAGMFKVLRMRKGPKDPQVAEDMMLGRR